MAPAVLQQMNLCCQKQGTWEQVTTKAFDSSDLCLEVVEFWLLHIPYCSEADGAQSLPSAAAGFQS